MDSDVNQVVLIGFGFKRLTEGFFAAVGGVSTG